MKRISITMDEYTLEVVDVLAKEYSVDRSTTIRMLILLAMKMAEANRQERRGEDGIQTSSGEDTEQP